MANDLNRAKVIYDADKRVFHEFMSNRAISLGLPVVMILEPDGTPVDKAEPKPLANLPPPTAQDSQGGERDRGALPLPAHRQCLPLRAEAVGAWRPYPLSSPARSIRAPSSSRRSPRQALAVYEALDQKKAGIQIAFGSMFALIALIVLLSAVWFGLTFANRLVAPVRRLIHATDQVATGNFYVQVPIRDREGDLAHLGETFNKMTAGVAPPARRPDRRRATSSTAAAASPKRCSTGVSAGVIGIDAEGVDHHRQPLRRKRSSGDLATRSSAQPIAALLPEVGAARRRGAADAAAHGPAADHDQPQRQGPDPRRPRRRRAGHARRAGLRRHPRRHHRPRLGAAHVRLGRRRAAHRARDQEPADADPAFGRTHPAQVRQGHHHGSRGLRPMHGDDRAPGRRHQADGRRVLVLRPHAEADDRRGGSRRDGAPGRVPDAHRPSGYRHRRRSAGRAGVRRLRPPARLPGRDEHRQERHRGDCRRAGGRARIAADRRAPRREQPEAWCSSTSPTTARAFRRRVGNGCSSPT